MKADTNWTMSAKVEYASRILTIWVPRELLEKPPRDREDSRETSTNQAQGHTFASYAPVQSSICSQQQTYRPWSFNISLKALFWLTLVPLSAGIAIWQISMLLSGFLGEPHYVSNSFFQAERHPTFPNVSVCSYNRVNRSKAQLLGLTDRAVEHLFLAQVATYQFNSGEYPAELLAGRRAWRTFLSRPDVPQRLRDAGTLFRHLAHSCEETFIECLFGGERFDCCSHAQQLLNAEYGACWVITPPVHTGGEIEPKQVWMGISGGLKLFVQPNLKEYMTSVTLNNYLEDGFLVSPTFDPYSGFFSTIAAVPPGKHAQIAMTKKVRESRKPQFEVFNQECTREGTLKAVQGTYTHSTCEDDCNQQIVMQMCNCTQIQEVKVKGYKACDGDDVVECVEKVTGNSWMCIFYRNTNDKSDFRLCVTNCRPTCHRIADIDIITSLNSYPGIGFQQGFDKWLKVAFNMTSSSVTRDLSLIDVFYPTNTYTEIVETEKVSLFELVGSIGGQMGIWLGASVLTSFEAIIDTLKRVIKSFSLVCRGTEVIVAEKDDSDKKVLADAVSSASGVVV